jgi:Fic family protein
MFDYTIIHNAFLGKYGDLSELEILKKSHQDALNYTAVLSKKNITELNREDILRIHFILFKDICPKFAGKYIESGERWLSLNNEERHKLCDPILIPDMMDNFFNWLFSNKDEHPIIIAAEAHNKFVCIHPFIDGNGRTGRQLMNLNLSQNGYVPVIIKQFKKEKYNEGINSWKNKNKDDFYSLIADCEEESLEIYLKEYNIPLY